MTKEKYILDQVKKMLRVAIDDPMVQMNDTLVSYNEELLEYIEELEKIEKQMGEKLWVFLQVS